MLVIGLYLLANLAYLCVLPLEKIQHAPADRVGTAAMEVVFGGAGAVIMAVAIIVSTFGCNNGLILAGARLYYAMGRDGLFFKSVASLNRQSVPGRGLVLQGLWTCLLLLVRVRTTDSVTGKEVYGNLYGNLLDYVVFSVLIFYVLTIAGLFVLRRKRPDVERPYKAFGYPVIPALYMVGATVIAVVLLFYKTQTTWPGLLIVLTGVPVYFIWRRGIRPRDPEAE
jgi:APA family basic amino acid/polyamine antiporter